MALAITRVDGFVVGDELPLKWPGLCLFWALWRRTPSGSGGCLGGGRGFLRRSFVEAAARLALWWDFDVRRWDVSHVTAETLRLDGTICGGWGTD